MGILEINSGVNDGTSRERLLMPVDDWKPCVHTRRKGGIECGEETLRA